MHPDLRYLFTRAGDERRRTLFLSPYEDDGSIRESAVSAAALTFPSRSCWLFTRQEPKEMKTNASDI
jgi:hypothetical protein